MGKKRKWRLRVGDRDRAILRYIGAQRMSWLEPLQIQFYPDHQADAVKSTLRRLTGHPPSYRYLRPEYLDSRRRYWRLTTAGARLIGLPEASAKPLGRIALTRNFAEQWFFVVDGYELRWPCSPEDYPEFFPTKEGRRTKTKFYLEKRDDGNRLGCALVDCGSDARRLSRRTVNLLDRLLRQRWLDEFIRGQKFEFTLLTNTDEKAMAIERLFLGDVKRRLSRFLRSQTGQQRVPCRTLVVPGLIDLLPTFHTKETGDARPR